MNTKNCFLLIVWLLAATCLSAAGQDMPGFTMPNKPKGKSAGKKGAGNKMIIIKNTSDDRDAPPIVVTKLKLKSPVIVYYEQAAPGNSVQQFVMEEDHLSLLKALSLEDLAARREVFLDGLGNMGLPGTNEEKFRLSGANLVAEDERRPAGDGRSTYSRLKVPTPGELYVVRESAEEYRHFVKSNQRKGAFLDFTANGLPGLDSVRAVYTLRKMDSAERGAGSGSTIR